MPIDGISAYFIAAELDRELKDMRVDRIRQPGRYDILFSMRAAGKSHQLLISANPSGPRIYLPETKQEFPPEAPMFCMLLRKHLQGGRLLGITTDAYERVFKLQFSSSNELGDRSEKTLIFECMGRHSNLILLNDEGVILDAIVHVDSRVNRYREVLPARNYVAPPAQDKRTAAAVLTAVSASTATAATLWQDLDLQKPIEKGLLACFAGFSPLMITAMLFEAELDPRTKPAQLSAPQWEKLSQVTLNMLTRIVSADIKPSVFYRSERDTLPYDFHVFDLALGKRKSFATTMELLSYFYQKRDHDNRFQQQKNAVLKRVQQLFEHNEKILQVHAQDFNESQAYASHKEAGELILANLYRMKEGDAELEVEDFYNNNQKRLIPLNAYRSPSWNAQTYFTRYNRLKRKNNAAEQHLREDQDKRSYLIALLDSIEHAENVGDLAMIKDEMKQQKLFTEKSALEQNKGLNFNQRKALRRRGGAAEKLSVQQTMGPRRYLSSDGIEIWVGRNNMQNDKLTLRSASKKDLWFHISKEAGSHVILACGMSNEDVPDRSIEEAATLAAWFSRASKANVGGFGAKVAVDYCPVSEVKKPAGAKPGMVIYDHYKTVYVTARAPEDLFPAEQIL